MNSSRCTITGPLSSLPVSSAAGIAVKATSAVVSAIGSSKLP